MRWCFRKDISALLARASIVLIAILCTAVFATAQTHPWPMHGGDAGHSKQGSTVGPISPAVAWDVALSGSPVARPAVAADGTVYVPTDANKIIAISSGAIKWSVTLGGRPSGTPALAADGTIFVTASNGKLYALAPNGSTKWEFSGQFPKTTPPVISPDGSAVYFAARENNYYYKTGQYGTIFGQHYPAKTQAVLYSVAPENAQIKWQNPSNDAITNIALDSSGNVYVTAVEPTKSVVGRFHSHYLLAYSSAGNQNWKTEFKPGTDDGADDGPHAPQLDSTLKINGGLIRVRYIRYRSEYYGNDVITTFYRDSQNTDLGSNKEHSLNAAIDGAKGIYYPSANNIVKTTTSGSPATIASSSFGNVKDLILDTNSGIINIVGSYVESFWSNGTKQWQLSTNYSSISSPTLGTAGSMYVYADGKLVCLANRDSDNDGVYDMQDAFKNDPAASKDTDDDGYPDDWNSGYSQANSTTGLYKDLNPTDPSIGGDADSDGVDDLADVFMYDPAASVDADHDGQPESWNTGKSQNDSTTGLVLDTDPSLPLGGWPTGQGATNLSNKGLVAGANGAPAPLWLNTVSTQGLSSPTVGYDGTIYAGSKDSKLYALWPNGTNKWAYAADGAITVPATVAKDRSIYVVTANNTLHVLWPNGTNKWTYNMDAELSSAPAIDDKNNAYMVTTSGMVHAVDRKGAEQWKYKLDGHAFRSAPIITSDNKLAVLGRHFGSYFRNIDQYSALRSTLFGELYAGIVKDNCYMLSTTGALLSTKELNSFKHNFEHAQNYYYDTNLGLSALPNGGVLAHIGGSLYSLSASMEQQWQKDNVITNKNYVAVSSDGSVVALGNANTLISIDKTSGATSTLGTVTDVSTIALDKADNITVFHTKGSEKKLTQYSLQGTKQWEITTLEGDESKGHAWAVPGALKTYYVTSDDYGNIRSYTYIDTDGDGVVDTNDAFPKDVAASVDNDKDGYPGAWTTGKGESDSTTGLKLDLDDNDPNVNVDADGDGVSDTTDAFPNDPAASEDSDGDGAPDAWNDGKSQTDSTSSPKLVLDDAPHNSNVQKDADKDGVDDSRDAFKNDPAASVDSDGDGSPDTWNTGKTQSDSTTGLTIDEVPNDASETKDADKDGIGDGKDAFPNDPSASVDTDKDGYPDNWNTGKSQGDSTTGLQLDTAPNDPNITVDSDGDGVNDSEDAFPKDAAASVDADGDGYPGKWNTGKSQSDSTTGLKLDGNDNDASVNVDTDGDKVNDHEDDFPNDPAASKDTDNDGLPDAWNAGKSANDSTTGLTKLDPNPTLARDYLPGQWSMVGGDITRSSRTPYNATASPTLKWTHDFGYLNRVSAPVLDENGNLYVNANGVLTSISPKGDVRWSHQVNYKGFLGVLLINSQPTIGPAGNIYCLAQEPDGMSSGSQFSLPYQTYKNLLKSYNPNGTQTSHVDEWAGGVTHSSIDWISANQTIIAGSNTRFVEWQTLSPLSYSYHTSYPDAFTQVSLPAVGADGTIYTASFNTNYMYTIAARTFGGSLQWKDNSATNTSRLMTDPNGTLYALKDGKLEARNPNGTVEWTYVTSADAVAMGEAGTVYLSDRDKLEALHANGTLKWTFQSPYSSHYYEQQTSGLVVDGAGTLYFGSRSNLYAIHANGTLKWKTLLGTGLKADLAIAEDGTLYALTTSGALYAFGHPDTDNDDVFDHLDAFPYDPAASVDTDKDGFPDKWNDGKSQNDSNSSLYIDDYPTDPAASKDTDGDGYPDAWNIGMNATNSTSNPKLTMVDQVPNDKDEHLDSDGDYVGDGKDAFPNDVAASVDKDNDGYPGEWNTGRSQNDSSTGLKLDSDDNDPNVNVDTDGDGVHDSKDPFPTDAAASVDTDGDGSPDDWNTGYGQGNSTTGLHKDAFPYDPAASKDADGDGKPDKWNDGKGAEDSNSTLSLDLFPNSAPSSSDLDGDGVPNDSDEFPNDQAASVDNDNDGAPDSWNNGTTKDDSTTGLTLDQNASVPNAHFGGLWGTAGGDNFRSGRSLYKAPMSPVLKWTHNNDSTLQGTAGLGPNGTIYVGDSSGITAVHSNGTKLWSFSAQGLVHGTPVIDKNGTVYFGTDGFSPPFYPSGIFAFNPDGSQKWKLKPDSIYDAVYGSAAFSKDGTLYLGTVEGLLYAVNPDGSKQWTYNMGSYCQSTPAIGPDGTIYIGNSDDKVYAIHANGTLKWTYTTGGDVKSSPSITPNGTIYVGSDDNKVYALNPDGTKLWDFTAGDKVEGSPAIAEDGTIYIASRDFKVYALNPDGTQKWTFTANGEFRSAPLIDVDGNILIGSLDQNLYALYPNGTKIWHYGLGSSIYATPTLGPSGNIYIHPYGSSALSAIGAPDTDGDGVQDNIDGLPNDAAASVDTDGDGYPDEWNPGKSQSDSTTGITLDQLPDNPNEHADADGDGVGDNADAFDNDAAASVDSDNDGSPDTWNEGYGSANSTTGLTLDLYPNDPTDNADTDGDGVGDLTDAFKNDPAASKDTDKDGYPDEWNPGKSKVDSTSTPKLVIDALPNDASEHLDSDLDGVGDNSDAFPFDAVASVDTDGDGYPNTWNTGANATNSTSSPQLVLDVFPNDATEHKDSDGDGVGDNADAFPNDPAASIDTDGDGVPNSWNAGANATNSTSDPKLFVLDQYPDDPTEYLDTDGDGVGNNADAFAYDPAASVDTDGDGYPDYWNTGMGESNSTSGLKKDDYPGDAEKTLVVYSQESGTVQIRYVVPADEKDEYDSGDSFSLILNYRNAAGEDQNVADMAGASEVSWISTSTDVATVDSTGKVTIVDAGKTLIRAAADGMVATMTISSSGTTQNAAYGNAIIVAANVPSTNKLSKAVKHTAKRMNTVFRKRGFDASDIWYMEGTGQSAANKLTVINSVTEVDPDIDSTSLTIADLQSALDWAAQQQNTGPLFLYMSGQGANGLFKLANGEILSASQLNSMLDKFTADSSRDVIVVLEANFSGSFITALEDTNRIILTSSNAIMPSFVSRDGRISFTQFLSNHLLKGLSWTDAFDKTVENLSNATAPFSTQNPQKSVGSNMVAKPIYGEFNLPAATPVMGNMTSGGAVQAGEHKLSVTMDQLDVSSASAWVTVIAPDYGPPSVPGAYETADTGIQTIALTNVDGTKEFAGNFNFSLNGKYQVVFYTQNEEGSVTSSQPVVWEIGGGTDVGGGEDPNTGQSATLSCGTGWNLLALPIIPGETGITTLMGSEYSKCKSIWKFVNNNWQVVLPAYSSTEEEAFLNAKGFSKVQTIEQGEGFWVDANESLSLVVNGTQSETTSYSVANGWSLIGWSGNASKPMSELSTQLGSGVSSVWKWENNNWAIYMPGETDNGESYATSKGFGFIQSMQPGEGFWVNVQ